MPGGKSAWTTACQSSPGPPGRASPHECPTVRETRDQTHHPTRVGSILHGAWRPYAGPRQGQVPPLPVVALDWPPRGSPCQIEPTTPKSTHSKPPRKTHPQPHSRIPAERKQTTPPGKREVPSRRRVVPSHLRISHHGLLNGESRGRREPHQPPSNRIRQQRH